VSRGRSGTFVSPSMPLLERTPAINGSEAGRQTADPEDFRYLFEAPYPLMPGLPSFDQFPRKLWHRTIARQARKGGRISSHISDNEIFRLLAKKLRVA
jgi:hypothetical protein